ncbi:MAG: M23 family metallopeptidase [Clostridia bacterium]
MNKTNYNRGFYIVLTLCIVAIGVAGYVNFNQETEPTAVVLSSENAVSNVEVPVVVEEEPPQVVITPVEIQEPEPVISQEETVEVIEEETVTNQATVTISPTVEITKTEEFYVKPCDGAIINENSLDELVKNASMNDWRTHNATDYYVTAGQNIVAIANGEVTLIETNDQYATSVEITHNDGLVTTIYGLNSETVAKIGDKVVAGDVIGTAIGSFPAEIAEGDHIHVEATRNGENIDVESLFG